MYYNVGSDPVFLMEWRLKLICIEFAWWGMESSTPMTFHLTSDRACEEGVSVGLTSCIFGFPMFFLRMLTNFQLSRTTS